MAFSYSPKIVTDGLVLYLDAGNTESYPGSGTTWTDLSRGQNPGTLINGPTFDSGNAGSIVFDGVDDNLETNFQPSFSYADGNDFTLEIWFYLGSSSYSMGLTAMRNSFRGWVWAARSISGNLVFSWFKGNGWVDLNSSPSQYISPAQWNLGNLVYDSNTNKVKFYSNGYYIGELDAGTVFDNNAPITIPRWDFNNSGYSNPQICSKYSVYNRALSAEEITQNYNATKGRFGL